MALAQSRVTAQGQISIPAEVRRRLAVGPGAILEWDEQGGSIIVRRATRFSSESIHDAIFGKRPVARKLHELKAGIAEAMRRKHARG